MQKNQMRADRKCTFETLSSPPCITAVHLLRSIGRAMVVAREGGRDLEAP
jgi:hypothetical protein